MDNIRSAVILAENEQVLSISSMEESVNDEKTWNERYTFQSWESLQANPLYMNLVSFKDVFLNPYHTNCLRIKALDKKLSSNWARSTVS